MTILEAKQRLKQILTIPTNTHVYRVNSGLDYDELVVAKHNEYNATTRIRVGRCNLPEIQEAFEVTIEDMNSYNTKRFVMFVLIREDGYEELKYHSTTL